LPARVTLAAAVAGSVLLLGGVVVFSQRGDDPAPGQPVVALPGPWEPPAAPSVPAPEDTPGASAPPAAPSPPAATPSKSKAGSPPQTRSPATRPAPVRPAGPNLSLGAVAGADGSSKAGGTRFGDVRDGDLGTFWSPDGTTGEISVKWSTPVTLTMINIREAAGGGTIRSWRVTNHDTGTVLATGSGARLITFGPVALRKITFEIRSTSGTPRVAEFETFAG
jgi:hypothetical protein